MKRRLSLFFAVIVAAVVAFGSCRESDKQNVSNTNTTQGSETETIETSELQKSEVGTEEVIISETSELSETINIYPWESIEFQYDWQRVYYEYCGNFDELWWDCKTDKLRSGYVPKDYSAFDRQEIDIYYMYIGDINNDGVPDIIINTNPNGLPDCILITYVNNAVQSLLFEVSPSWGDLGYVKETGQFLTTYSHQTVFSGINKEYSVFNWTLDGYVETNIRCYAEAGDHIPEGGDPNYEYKYFYRPEEGEYGQTFIDGEEVSNEEFGIMLAEMYALKEKAVWINILYSESNPEQYFPLLSLDDVGGDFIDYIAKNLFY